MGKKKNRKRAARRSRGAKTARIFGNHSRQRQVEDTLASERYREEQKKFASELLARETELLTRAIYVTNVKDLNRSQNLTLLRQFLERNFGPVVTCTKVATRKNFPAARVIFQQASDAQRIFGQPSHLVREAVLVPCSSVGHRGQIRVSRSQRFEGMLGSNTDASDLALTGSSISIGHWFPADREILNSLRPGSSVEAGNQWLEEARLDRQVGVSINIETRTIKLFLPAAQPENNSHSPRPSVPWESDFFSSIAIAPLSSLDYFECSFRFKDLSRGAVRIVNEAGIYSIVFDLVHAPNFSKEDILANPFSVRGVDTGRGTSFGPWNTEVLGHCLAYKVTISESQLQDLVSDRKRVRQLQKFGVIDHNFTGARSSTPLETVVIGRFDAALVDSTISTIPSPRVGLLLRALVDQLKVTWFDLINHEYRGKKCVDMLRTLPPEPVEKVRCCACEEMLCL